MTICYASREFFPFYYGGIGSHFYFQMKMLKENGHRVVFVTVKYDNTDEQLLNKHYDGIELVFIDKSVEFFSTHTNMNNSYQLWKTIDDLISNKNYHFDYIIFPDCGAEGFFTVLNKTINDLYPESKVLIEIEGPMKDVAIRNKDFVDGHFELTKMMEEFCYINCNFFTSPSKIMFDELHNNIDMDNVEYEIVPNLVNANFLQTKSNVSEVRKNVFFMGRLEYRKGPDLLIEAFAEIVDEGFFKNSFLQFAGRDQFWVDYNKTFQEHWTESLNANQLQRIEYLEFLSHEELREIFSRTWVAVFPSRWEPFGNVALESILAGVPVIIPRGTGLAEIVGNNYEFLFDAGNKDSLKDVLSRVLSISLKEHKILSSKFKHRGRELLNSSETIFKNMLENNLYNHFKLGKNEANSRRIFEIFYSFGMLGGDNSKLYEELEKCCELLGKEFLLLKQYFIKLKESRE